nr:apolipoprotein A-I-like [Anolis sagrei ordinatus]
MKLWIISLALAVFAGSQALVIRSAPEPHAPSKLSELLDDFDHFMDEIDNTTDHRWEQFKKSETGKIIAEWLEDEDEAATKAPAEGQAPKEEEGFVEAVIDLVGDMFNIGEKAIDEIDKHSTKIWKKLKAEVVAAVGYRLDPVVERVRPYLVPMMKEAIKNHEGFNPEMDAEFQKSLDSLDKVAPQYLQKVSAYFSKLL